MASLMKRCSTQKHKSVSRNPCAGEGRRRLVLALWLLVAPCLLSANAAEASAGVRLYSVNCASCHGDKGQGNAALRGPALAGLDEVYLLRQLQHFRDGVRGSHPEDRDGAVMRAALTPVSSDAQLSELLVAISKLPPPVSPTVPAGADLVAGRNYYNGICSACHGATGEGKPALKSPRVIGQSAAYRQRQFGHFRNKIRGGHAADKFGGQMVKITKAIPDDKLSADIAAYIVQLSQQAKR